MQEKYVKGKLSLLPDMDLARRVRGGSCYISLLLLPIEGSRKRSQALFPWECVTRPRITYPPSTLYNNKKIYLRHYGRKPLYEA